MTLFRSVAMGILGLGSMACGPELGTPPAMCSTTAVNAGRSPEMEPGGDCIGCHASNDGPGFLLAGTVMASLHDDTNCNGVANVTVKITGADGKQLTLTTNRTGNFYSEARASALVLPFKAEVIRGGKTNAMVTAQTVTDCGSCHTAEGSNLAPGRILAPPP
jgi:mono/diheme cytochrome c family protein